MEHRRANCTKFVCSDYRKRSSNKITGFKILQITASPVSKPSVYKGTGITGYFKRRASGNRICRSVYKSSDRIINMTKKTINSVRYSGIQPQYFPRLHYFARILATDIFVIRNDAQYVRKHKYPNGSIDKSYQAHSPIKQALGRQLLSVPTQHEGFAPLAATKIFYDQTWMQNHLKALQIA